MARTDILGFDTSDITLEGTGALPSGVSFDSTTPDGIGKSLKIVPASGSGVSHVDLPTTGNWRRLRVRFTVLPSVTRAFVGTSGVSAALRIKTDGTVEYRNSASTLIGTSVTALTDTARWYTVEWLSSSSSSSLVRLRIDGFDEVTTADTSTFSASVGTADTAAATYTMYVDDYVTDNAGFPGPGAVRLLLPISDNARAALWVAGSNATTSTSNLWEGVNNLPPVGTATSLPVANGISHEGGAAGSTDDYDANMTRYADAGIRAGATINAMQAICVHAEDISTGAKLLTMSVKSNPAQGAFETNFTAGNGSAAGTYPTNWVLKRGTIISNPANINLVGNAVMTMRRPETATRRADVCFMGIYLDFTQAGLPSINTFAALDRASSW
jgi:hypothetical protein